MLWLELIVVLGAILLGARVGGVGLGTMAALGLLLLVFVFRLPPASPPGAVIAIVVAVVTAAASLEAAGGMDFLVLLADRVLRAHPRYITLIAPLVAYAFTFCTGTGHVAYSILPVIAEVARKAGIRPERPMSISVIASQQAITASPLAAATAALLTILDGQGVTLAKILLVCVPSTLIGVVAGALSVWKKGVELKDDPEYQRRLSENAFEQTTTLATLDGPTRRRAARAVAIFLLAAATIVAFGVFPTLRPTYSSPQASVSIQKLSDAISSGRLDADNDRVVTQAEARKLFQNLSAGETLDQEESLQMNTLIQIVMYAAAALMMLFCGASPDAAAKSKVAGAGVVAVVSILGLGWMGNCFFEGNKDVILTTLSGTVQQQPWLFAGALFALSILLFSQASTVTSLMPVGVALGVSAGTLVAYFPAVNGYFFLPTYGTVVAAVAFDRSGTTRIGSYVLNHSFMRPGIVATVTAILSGLAISRLVF
ncbi:MAG: anaerobic C4-dicarboxylate transporter family protein [Phycisphaerales bacterium]|nr:anaerobic C4-dicarboxylate transporter [Planctomycetota bacterium]